MTIGFKRSIFIIVFLTVGVGFILPAAHKSKYLEAEGLGFEGVVTHIEWKTKNHALPLFKIEDANGSLYSLNNGELNLKKSQLHVGDAIIKGSGSRYCYINKVEFECVDEFIEFHKAVLRAFNDDKPNA